MEVSQDIQNILETVTEIFLLFLYYGLVSQFNEYFKIEEKFVPIFYLYNKH